MELHPWAATVDDIEMADKLIFDLDPGANINWSFVIETALRLRQMVLEHGFETWPKLTGGKGLHVIAPLQVKITHDAAHICARRFAERLAATQPQYYVTSARLAQRPGRLFIDYLRNGRGTTAIGPYSPRVRQRFPIAAPVTWPEVERGTKTDTFTIERIPPPIQLRATPIELSPGDRPSGARNPNDGGSHRRDGNHRNMGGPNRDAGNHRTGRK